MYALSLPWNILNWLISLLTGRKIILKNGSFLAQPKIINRSIVHGSGIRPTVYIIHGNDLRPHSSANILFKYAEDTNLRVPENSDVSVPVEFENVQVWTLLNKMLINFSKD